MIIANEYTSKFVYNTIKLEEIGNIIENTRLEHDQKFGVNYYRKVKVKCVVEFLYKIKN